MIKFENVYKEYNNGVAALSNINIEVPRGDFVFLVGPSGAGKSTMIKLLIREEKVNRGKIFIGDNEITKISKYMIPKLRRNISVVFQDFRLLEKKTAFENVAFALEILGESKKEINKKVEYALDLVNLSDKVKDYPSELSGGESQRVAIARAIVNDAPYLVCDEPTGNLDSKTSMDVILLMQSISKQFHQTTIMITHNEEIAQMADRTIRIEDGKVVSGGVKYAR